jgi:sialic acid synthase SpsE
MPSELANRERVRKSIVAAAPIARGEVFTEAALACKRPATPLAPLWDALVGRPPGATTPRTNH